MGRTSYEKQTKLINEVKKMEIQDRLNTDGSLMNRNQRILKMDDLVSNMATLLSEWCPMTANIWAEMIESEACFQVEH